MQSSLAHCLVVCLSLVEPVFLSISIHLAYRLYFLSSSPISPTLLLFGRPVNYMLATSGTGRPRSAAFEHQVRSLLASGCSARATREQLLQSARMFLRPDAAAAYANVVPNLRWFQAHREALGNEAWLYSMVELTRANECLQHGFDETSIDGTPTQSMGPTACGA